MPATMATGWIGSRSSPPLEDQKLFHSLYAVTNAETVCEFVTFAKENPGSIRSCVAAARENARTVREYISSEMWERINSMYLWLNSAEARQLFAASAIDFFRHVVDYSHQFHGTTAATLTHGEGWDFLQIGKYLERADSTSRLLDLKYHILLPRGEEVGGNVDTVQWQAVLKSCSGFEAYRKIYTGQVTPGDRRGVHPAARQLPSLHPLLRRGRRRRPAPHLRLPPARNSPPRPSGSPASCVPISITRPSTTSSKQACTSTFDGIQLRLIEISTAMNAEYCEWLEPAMEQSQSQSQGAA
ncbi:MAG: alpha-E domain-containing protein [Chthoniobacter sp.]